MRSLFGRGSLVGSPSPSGPMNGDFDALHVAKRNALRQPLVTAPGQSSLLTAGGHRFRASRKVSPGGRRLLELNVNASPRSISSRISVCAFLAAEPPQRG